MARRLAAILSADVVGYSRLMAADEEGTHARLKGHRGALIDPTIAGHGGRVVKLTGDGALVEFASVVQAVQCAVEVQRGMAARNAEVPEAERIALRIGINIGDIIIEDDDIYGDGVNVAVRLQQLADSGGIWVARNVYDQVKSKVGCRFEPMGEHFVKNIPEAVVAYRALVDPTSIATGPAAQPSRLEPAEAARQEWMEHTATTARQIRAMLAANEAITELLWSVAAGAADMVRADDESETAAADLRADAIAPVEAKRRLAAADQKRSAARRRVRAGLAELAARIGEPGGGKV
jgi:class 3 adenylate cyclase